VRLASFAVPGARWPGRTARYPRPAGSTRPVRTAVCPPGRRVGGADARSDQRQP
jgi:hypothetical protein